MAEMQAIMMQLAGAQDQVARLSMAIDAIRREASAAVQELRECLAAEQRRTESLQSLIERGGNGGRDWNLVSTKIFKGGKFIGSKTESFRLWTKHVKFFCQRHGFKKALDEIDANEDEAVGVRVLENMRWEFAEAANVKLADFLQSYCGDDALRIVEACPDPGFEAWRRFKKRKKHFWRTLRVRQDEQHAGLKAVQRCQRHDSGHRRAGARTS